MTRRDEILAAALRLVAEQGLGALTVRAVADAAGIGPTTLRHYFPSQAELHEAVAGALMTSAIDDRRIADRSVDPAERLAECLEQFLPASLRDPTALGVWFEMHRMALGADARPLARALLAQGHRTGAAALRRWLGLLADEGWIAREDVETEVTVALALVDGLALHLLADPTRVDPDAVEAALRWFADRAIRRDGPTADGAR
ncbi:MAG: hypothetical protein BGO95_04370 [Micrococcales bacterium 73-13]|nr:MAG: hypothetical protein BGO95_04370 [Micrococcales bacterium 73-13]